MDTDLALVMALLLWLLSLPSFASAYSEWRFPRLPFALVGLGAGLFVFAIRNGPGYAMGDVPDVVVRVLARLFN